MVPAAVPFAAENFQTGSSLRQQPSSQYLVPQAENVTTHHLTPLGYTKRYRGMNMRNTNAQATRTLQQPISNPLKDKRLLTKETKAAIKADFGGERSYLKVVARHAEASPRTVESWTSEEAPTLPGFEYIARMLPQSKSLQKLVLRLMALSPDNDPEYHRALQDLRRAIG
jgi:hypothetical protein